MKQTICMISLCSYGISWLRNHHEGRGTLMPKNESETEERRKMLPDPVGRYRIIARAIGFKVKAVAATGQTVVAAFATEDGARAWLHSCIAENKPTDERQSLI